MGKVDAAGVPALLERAWSKAWSWSVLPGFWPN